MSGTQILMTIFNFYFFWNHFLEGDFTFPWGRGFIFKWGGTPWGGGASTMGNPAEEKNTFPGFPTWISNKNSRTISESDLKVLFFNYISRAEKFQNNS